MTDDPVVTPSLGDSLLRMLLSRRNFLNGETPPSRMIGGYFSLPNPFLRAFPAPAETVDVSVELSLEQSSYGEITNHRMAMVTAVGIVQGLYGVRDSGGDGVLAHAGGFPAETAGHAVATLARESARVHKRRWFLPEDFLPGVAEWKAMLSRVARSR